MSVNDEADLAWLAPEKVLVREAIAREIPIVGVCLGAQLIASALGACVYRSQAREIGWFSVQAVPASAPTFTFPSACTAFHWHSETFDLPDRAVRLASSVPCANQAFSGRSECCGPPVPSRNDAGQSGRDSQGLPLRAHAGSDRSIRSD